MSHPDRLNQSSLRVHEFFKTRDIANYLCMCLRVFVSLLGVLAELASTKSRGLEELHTWRCSDSEILRVVIQCGHSHNKVISRMDWPTYVMVLNV